jgi:hypothetical protein
MLIAAKGNIRKNIYLRINQKERAKSLKHP